MEKNKYVVKTSDLGYNISVYEVVTNLPISEFQNIDNKYGARSRFSSTTIEDLKNGAIKEGYTFDYKIIVEKTTDFKKYHQDLKHDYYANTGNY